MIDRKKVVERHFPTYTKIEPLAPLSVGNGEFAFTADITGLQTFPSEYEVPLGTQSQWGWHYTQKPNLYDFKDIKLQSLETHGRRVSYPLYPEGHDEAYHWLRQNPHRVQLGQVSFRFIKENGEQAESRDIEGIKQTLNLWEGVLYSEFLVAGVPVKVVTTCHPKIDQVSVKVNSPLVKDRRLQIVVRFPNPDMTSRDWDKSIFLNWEHREGTVTKLSSTSEHSAFIERIIDHDKYKVNCAWSSGKLTQTCSHELTLFPDKSEQELHFLISFAPEKPETSSFYDTISASKAHWENFWRSGGAIDLSESSDKRAHELERRIVLSQFLLAIHSAGSTPPQETGLMYNSWFGKFHLEMHWWHAAHFPLWGRGDLLDRSVEWYTSIFPIAKELAASQGYEGVRWPKMVGIDGQQSPSPIAPALIWQQPHPISLAELCYKERPSEETLNRWKEIVIETANFMASYVVWDEEKEAYILGPPLIPAQECHKPEESYNPPYELEYWKYGLEIAIKWVERLGEKASPKWGEVANQMAEPPTKDGVYLAHEGCLATFSQYNHDHPSMVGAYGILPGSLIDPEKMRKTLQRVREEWQWETAWGWDFPMCAMTAARLGEGHSAVDFLLMDAAKNKYLPNGHNYQRPGLTIYLPGNGALLTAVSMMACGWEGAPDGNAPGFPKDGTWVVKSEGLFPSL